MMCFIFFIVEKLNAEWQKMDGWLGVVFSEKKSLISRLYSENMSFISEYNLDNLIFAFQFFVKTERHADTQTLTPNRRIQNW
jgi:hypothetical protein